MTKNKKKLTKATKRRYLFCYIMLLPAFWGMFSYLFVNIQYLSMAFQVSEGSGFSLNNWKIIMMELVQENSTIWIALENTWKFWAVSMIKVPVSFVIAYFLYKKIWGHKFFRVVFFVPSLVAPVILVTIFKDIIKIGGPLYVLIYKLFQYEIPNLIADYGTATNTILFYTVWIGFGMNLLIFMGSMNRISSDILDAARIDGCGPFREFISIITPMCWEMLSTMLLLSAITIFTADGPILYFTGGNYNTYTLGYWIFQQVRDGSYYYPSAVGLFFTIVGLPFVLLIRFLMKKGDKEVAY